MDKGKVIWYLELLAKIGMLTLGFLQACSVTFGKPIISYFLWPTVLLGAVMILIRLIHWKQYWRSKNFFLLVAFCASYLISIVANIHYGWYTNITTLIWLGLLLFLVYCYCADEPTESSEKQYRVLTIYYLIGNAILALVGFGCMIFNYSEIHFQEVGPIYYIGFHWGRLFGVYWDANIGALMCCIAVLLSVGLFGKVQAVWAKILLVLNIILSVMYITFSDSRTGKLCLCVGVAIFAFTYLWNQKKIVYAIVSAIVLLVICYYVPTGIKTGYNKIIEEQIALEIEQDKQDSHLAEALGREEDYSSDISNRRFDIWKNAIQIFKSSPVVGITHNDVLAYVEEKLPDSYIITNDYMKFESMHNGFLDILVAQGALGFGIYILMIIGFLITLFKNWTTIFAGNSSVRVAQFAILGTMVLATCVMSEIVYVTSPMSTVFWLSLGGLMKASTQSKKEIGK